MYFGIVLIPTGLRINSVRFTVVNDDSTFDVMGLTLYFKSLL